MATRVKHKGFEINRRKPWRGDYSDRLASVPGGAKLNAADFDTDGTHLTTVDGAVAADAVLITLDDALPKAIKKGTIIFTTADESVVVVASADVAAGEVAIPIYAAASAIADAAEVKVRGAGQAYIPSGTLVGRTFAERAAKAPYGPADVANDDEMYLTLFDVYGEDGETELDVELYRHNRIVKENFLPDWDTYSGAEQAVVRDLYTSTIGAD